MAEYSFGRFEKTCLDNGVQLHHDLIYSVHNRLRSNVRIEPDEMFSAIDIAADMIQKGEDPPADRPIPPLEIDEQDVVMQTLRDFINGAQSSAEQPLASWTLPMGSVGGDSCASTEGRFATTFRQIAAPGQPVVARFNKYDLNFQVVADKGRAVAIKKYFGVRTTLVLEPVRLIHKTQQTQLICPPGAVLLTPLIPERIHDDGERFQEIITPDDLLRGSFLRLSAFALPPKRRRRDFNPHIERFRPNARIHKSWTMDDIKEVAQGFIDSQG
jgi:hypothetical protein